MMGSLPELINLPVVAVFLCLAATVGYRSYQLLQQRRIRQWQRHLNLQQHQQVYNDLYQSVDGFKLSSIARIKQDAIACTYGEIEFMSFIALLSIAKLHANSVFYDLGSGIGKPVIACALVFQVKRCVGIEWLPSLYEVAYQRAVLLSTIPHYTDCAKKIVFLCTDFFNEQLNEATFIFINATTLLGSIWIDLSEKLDHLECLETVITTSKPLKSLKFTVIKQTKVCMSWGIVSAYIHKQKNIF